MQKYGGSSVADADSIKRVAKRIVATKREGLDVVVVISAMGDTTDELRDLALQVSPLPPPRELDMLLTAGERASRVLQPGDSDYYPIRPATEAFELNRSRGEGRQGSRPAPVD